MNGEGEQQGDAVPRATRLARALEARTPDREELHSAVCEYVQATVAAGLPVTTAIIGIKSALRHGARGEPEQFDALARRVVTWCIEEYYRAAPGR